MKGGVKIEGHKIEGLLYIHDTNAGTCKVLRAPNATSSLPCVDRGNKIENGLVVSRARAVNLHILLFTWLGGRV